MLAQPLDLRNFAIDDESIRLQGELAVELLMAKFAVLRPATLLRYRQLQSFH